MILHVLDKNLNRIGTIQRWKSLSWQEEYKGLGAFSMVVNDTPQYAALLSQGCFFYRKDRPRTIMRAVLVDRKGANSTITVGGYSALHMLSWRVALDKKKITNAEEGILALVEENMRGLPIVIGNSSGYDDETDLEIGWGPLDEAVISILEETELGFRMSLDFSQKKFLFEVYKGRDLSYKEGEGGYVFSPGRKNLDALQVTEDDDLYKNVAVIVCPSGDSKTVFYYPAEHERFAGIERRELIVDGEQQGDRSYQQWEKDMLQLGQEALQERSMICTFTAEPKAGDMGTLYELGDLVTCQNKRYGLRFDARITQFKQTFNESGVKSVLTLGKPAYSFFRGELIKHG